MKAYLLLALLVAAPAAEAKSSGSMTFNAGFTELTVEVQASIVEQDAADIRGAADEYGNADGQATQAEADKFVHDFESLIASGVFEGFSDGNLTLDGKAPKDFEIEALALADVAGPVTSFDPIRMTLTGVLEFTPGAGETHTMLLRGGTDETAEVDINAPSGHVIQSHSGIQGTLDADKDTLSFTQTTADTEDVAVVFAKAPAPAGTKGSPGPAAALLAVALAGLAAARRK